MFDVKYILKWAQTLDGQLCDDSNSSKWISGSEERVKTHEIRKEVDAVLVGARTFINDLAKLTVREIGLSKNERQPVRIILDPRNRVLEEVKKSKNLMSEIMDNNLRKTILLCDISKTNKDFEKMSEHGILFEDFSLDFSDIDFFTYLDSLMIKNKISKVLVEGGPRILSHFVDRKEYQEVIVSVSNKLTGGQSHRIKMDRLLLNAMEHCIEEVSVFEGDVMIRFTPKGEILSSKGIAV